jgi:hypothetical protein
VQTMVKIIIFLKLLKSHKENTIIWIVNFFFFGVASINCKVSIIRNWFKSMMFQESFWMFKTFKTWFFKNVFLFISNEHQPSVSSLAMQLCTLSGYATVHTIPILQVCAKLHKVLSCREIISIYFVWCCI